MGEFLTAKGHQVASCGSLSGLREWLDAGHQADVAFLDWTLPDATGDVAAALLRAARPTCTIVAATGLSAADLDHTNIDDVLSKPFRIKTLHEVIQRFSARER